METPSKKFRVVDKQPRMSQNPLLSSPLIPRAILHHYLDTHWKHPHHLQIPHSLLLLWNTITQAIIHLQSFLPNISSDSIRSIITSYFIAHPIHNLRSALTDAFLSQTSHSLILVSAILNRLGWSSVLQQVAAQVIADSTNHRISQVKPLLHQHTLSDLIQWLDSLIQQTIVTSLSAHDHPELVRADLLPPLPLPDLLQHTVAVLRYNLLQQFVDLRSSQLFDLIRSSAEQQSHIPAVEDLRTALKEAPLQDKVVRTLIHSFRTRLMHPGAQTDDILTVYMLSINVLRSLDPSGEILSVSTHHLTQYLRSRSDTVHCIVQRLIDRDEICELDLYAALRTEIDSKKSQDSILQEQNPLAWEPPRSSIACTSLRILPDDFNLLPFSQARNLSIFSMLMRLAESQDIFLAEYRKLLEERLLKLQGYSIDQELANLELLKMRFGESSSELMRCQVMINDVENSRRIRNAIPHNDDGRWLFPKIISYNYWPGLREDDLSPPSGVRDVMNRFCVEYEKIRASREIKWKTSLGSVTLELEDDSGKIVLKNCTAIQASVLLLFSEGHPKSITIEDVCRNLEITEDMCTRTVEFWKRQGALIEEEGKFILGSVLSESEVPVGDVEILKEAGDDGSKRKNILDRVVSLCRLGGMRIGQLHNVLLICGSDIGYDWKESDLMKCVEDLCTNGNMECKAGIYKTLL